MRGGVRHPPSTTQKVSRFSCSALALGCQELGGGVRCMGGLHTTLHSADFDSHQALVEGGHTSDASAPAAPPAAPPSAAAAAATLRRACREQMQCGSRWPTRLRGRAEGHRWFLGRRMESSHPAFHPISVVRCLARRFWMGGLIKRDRLCSERNSLL